MGHVWPKADAIDWGSGDPGVSRLRLLSWTTLGKTITLRNLRSPASDKQAPGPDDDPDSYLNWVSPVLHQHGASKRGPYRFTERLRGRCDSVSIDPGSRKRAMSGITDLSSPLWDARTRETHSPAARRSRQFSPDSLSPEASGRGPGEDADNTVCDAAMNTPKSGEQLDTFGLVDLWLAMTTVVGAALNSPEPEFCSVPAQTWLAAMHPHLW